MDPVLPAPDCVGIQLMKAAAEKWTSPLKLASIEQSGLHLRKMYTIEGGDRRGGSARTRLCMSAMRHEKQRDRERQTNVHPHTIPAGMPHATAPRPYCTLIAICRIIRSFFRSCTV